MIKTFLKNVATIGTLIVLWTAYSIGFLSMNTYLNGLTAVIFVAVIALAAEDVFTKALNDRTLFTWQYAVLMAFVVVCDLLWVFWALCVSWLQFFGRGFIVLLAVAGTCAWAWWAYRISVMSEEERKLLTLTKAWKKLAKKFPSMSDEEVRSALESAMFCALENNSLEGSLLVSQPFTADYATLTELTGRDDGTDYTSIIKVMNSHITALIANRSKEAN